MLPKLNRKTIAHIENLLPYLKYARDGRLKIAGVDASDILQRDGTPLILFVADRLEENYRSIRDAYEKFFGKVEIFFAVKSCYLSKCIQTLRRLGAGIEVMSDLELQIALQNGYSGTHIVANGVGRNAVYFRRCFSPPLHLNIIDGLEDLMAVASLARELGLVAEIALRVTPPTTGDGLLIGTSSKLGIDWEDGIFLAVLRRALEMPELKVTGLMFHQLNHARSIGQYSNVMEAASAVVLNILDKTKHKFEILDIGGGLETRFLLENEGVTAVDFARAAHHHLSQIPYDFTLQIEPGRYIVGDAAIGLSNVVAEKRNARKKWRITDIGSNILIPLPDISYYPIPTKLPQDGRWGHFNVGDATCAPSLLCADAVLPTGKEGRELAILNCGGYTTVFAELWAFVLPKILFLGSDGVEELFGHAQFAEMFKAFYGYNVEI